MEDSGGWRQGWTPRNVAIGLGVGIAASVLFFLMFAGLMVMNSGTGGGYGLDLERLEGNDGINPSTPTLTEEQMASLPKDVRLAFERALAVGQAHTGISEGEYQQVAIAFAEDAQLQESPRTVIFRDTVFSYGFLGG